MSLIKASLWTPNYIDKTQPSPGKVVKNRLESHLNPDSMGNEGDIGISSYVCLRGEMGVKQPDSLSDPFMGVMGFESHNFAGKEKSVLLNCLRALIRIFLKEVQNKNHTFTSLVNSGVLSYGVLLSSSPSQQSVFKWNCDLAAS